MRSIVCFVAALAVAAALATAGKGKPGGGGGTPPDPAIAYASGGTLYVVDADGSHATVVVEGMGAGRPSWSPDGTQIAFGAYYDDTRTPGVDVHGIYVVNVDGTGLRKVIEQNDLNAVAVAWSPKPAADGEFKLAFADSNPIPGVGGNTDIFVVNLDGTGLANLTYGSIPGRVYEFWPSWSKDADRIAVLQTGPDVDTDVVVHDLGLVDGVLAITGTLNLTSEDDVPGGSLNDVDLTGCVPAWAKTGDQVAVMALSDIWVIDLADPADPVNVTNTPTVEERFPSFSPDDSDMAFWIPGTAKVGGIYLASTGRIVKGGGPLDWRRNP